MHRLFPADLVFLLLAIAIPSSMSLDCAARDGNQVPFTISIKTDSNPEQNSFKLFVHKQGVWKEKKFRKRLESNEVNTYEMCLFTKRCFKFEINDTEGDGITGGYYNINLDGEELAHSEFDNDKEVVQFGLNCATSKPDGTSSPSSNLSTSLPSTSSPPSLPPSVSAVPSVSNGPSIPSLSNGPSSICATRTGGNQVPLTILIKTDSKPNENSFKLFFQKNGTWQQKFWNDSNLVSNYENRFDMCIFRKRCFRFEMNDTGGDGITGGYYSIYLDDEKVAHSEFNNGNEVVKFGINCESDVPSGSPSDSSSVISSAKPSDSPSVLPSTSPPTTYPTDKPTEIPTLKPSQSSSPSLVPSLPPSGSPTSMPSLSFSPSVVPSSSSEPSISNAPSTYCDSKPGTQVPFEVEIKTDGTPEQNSFKLLAFKLGEWEQILYKTTTVPNELNIFEKCLFYKRCFRFQIFDSVGDGIDEGYYRLILDGEEVARAAFNNGFAESDFGGVNCDRDVPDFQLDP